MVDVLQVLIGVFGSLIGVVLGFLLKVLWDKRLEESRFDSYLRLLLHELTMNIRILNQNELRTAPVQIPEVGIVNILIEPPLVTTAYTSFIFSGYFEKLPDEIRSDLEELYALIATRNILLESNIGPQIFNFDLDGRKLSVRGFQIISAYTSIIRKRIEEVRSSLLKYHSKFTSNG